MTRRARTALLAATLIAGGCIGPHLRKPVSSGEGSAARKGEPIAVRGESRIRDLAYISYAVPPERVRKHVPRRFELLTRVLPAGERAFVSLVWFGHDDLKAEVPLSPVVDGAEVNLRTYVRDRESGEEAVWFLDLAFSPPVGAIFNVGTGAAARNARCRLTTRSDAQGRSFYGLNADRRLQRDQRGWIEDLGTAPGPAPGFSSGDELRAFLVDRHVGFYPRGRGQQGVGRMEVEHQRLALRVGRLHSIQMPRALALGLLDADTMGQPHSVLLSKGARFRVYITRDVTTP